MNKSSPLAKLIAETTRTNSPAEKLKVSLFKSLRDSNPPRAPKADMFSPSSMNKCEREIWYRIHATEPDADLRPPSLAGRINSILQNGNDRHERLQERIASLKDEGHGIEWVDVAKYIESKPELNTKIIEKQGYETKLYNEDISARFLCDGVVVIDGKYHIIEIKTMNSRKWASAQKAGKPLDEHLEQAACYSIALNIDDILYIYENRESLDLGIYHHKVTGYQKENLISKIRRVQEYKKLGVAPPMTKDVKKCTYCDYKLQCAQKGLTMPKFGEWDG